LEHSANAIHDFHRGFSFRVAFSVDIYPTFVAADGELDNPLVWHLLYAPQCEGGVITIERRQPTPTVRVQRLNK
jgi:hypothetical protein